MPWIASMPKAIVAAQPASSSAGSTVMSPVGISSASSNTFSPRPRWPQIWLMAAPPAAKFDTMAAVTEAG